MAIDYNITPAQGEIIFEQTVADSLPIEPVLTQIKNVTIQLLQNDLKSYIIQYTDEAAAAAGWVPKV